MVSVNRRSALLLSVCCLLSPLSVTHGQVELRYQLEKGQTSLIQIKSESKIQQKIMGIAMDSTINQSSLEARTIDEVDAQGIAKLKSKTERLKVDAKLAQIGDYHFDSTNADRDRSSIAGRELTPLHERLTGAELSMEVSTTGKVQSVTGFGQLVADVAKGPLAAQFILGGDDAAGKLTYQGHWLTLDTKAVRPGDEWESSYEQDIRSVGTIKLKETTKLNAIVERDGHQIAQLSTSADVTVDLKSEVDGAKVSGTLSTTQSSGSAEFDITAGKLLKMESSVTLAGQINIAVNGMMIPIDMNETASTVVETLDKRPE